MTSVRVWVPFIVSTGVIELEWTSPCTTADQFEAGVLTITHVPDGDVIQTFQPDQWIRVTVYGADGYPNFSFRNDRAWLGRIESQQRTA